MSYFSDYKEEYDNALKALRLVAGQAYQVIGALTVDIDNNDSEIIRALDYFSNIANEDMEATEDFLPFTRPVEKVKKYIVSYNHSDNEDCPDWLSLRLSALNEEDAKLKFNNLGYYSSEIIITEI